MASNYVDAFLPHLRQQHPSSVLLLTGLVLGLVSAAYWLFLAVYRVYFHPLSVFPGPRRACTSENWLYRETKRGAPEETFEKLHRQFDTKALRIGPNELHITDIELYKVIYNQSKPFLKYAPFYDGFNTPHTVFAEIDPVLHKERRRLLNPMFARTGVFQLEPMMVEKVKLLGRKFDRLCHSQLINTYDAFRLLTTEIIMQFAFSRSAGMIEEQENGFGSWFLDGFDVAAGSIADMQYNPWMRRLSNLLPMSLVRMMSKEIGILLDILDFAASSMRHWQSAVEKPSHPVVFDNLTSIPDAYKVTEAMDILIAGADTTASSLTTGLLHILTQPDVHNKLMSALQDANSTNEELPSLRDLEKIDYLNACVKESIRMAMAVPGRLPRVVPGGDSEPFVVDGKIVPPGTVVSMSTYTMHTSVEAWGPDASSFNPDRWLGPDAKKLEQYQCAFSKGARMCIGQNLAPAEITIVLAYIFRKYKLSLPKDFTPPERIDRFTFNYLKPGLNVKFEKRL